jgi:hypothetical protein
VEKQLGPLTRLLRGVVRPLSILRVFLTSFRLHQNHRHSPGQIKPAGRLRLHCGSGSVSTILAHQLLAGASLVLPAHFANQVLRREEKQNRGSRKQQEQYDSSRVWPVSV